MITQLTFMYNPHNIRIAEMGSNVLNDKVAPAADKALSALNLGKKAFKFTKIKLGSMKPKISSLK